MPDLKGLIFDVDGTLAENEQNGHRVAFNRAFADAGLDWCWDEETYDRLLRVFGGKERMRYYIDDFLGGLEGVDDLDGFIREVHASKTEHYGRLLRTGAIPLRPGIGRLIREAHEAGLKLAIASTTTLTNATTLLAQSLGDESVTWFDVFACGDVVANKKPAPDIFLHALVELGLEASECLAVEDSHSGLASARAAGLRTLVTVSTSTLGQDFTGAALVLDGLGEPGAPFMVLGGDAEGARWVDVDFLRRLHARNKPGA